MRGADASPAMIANASMRIQKPSQNFDVFIIDIFDIVIAEVTKFHPVRVL
jgi:hypothetical protein